MKKILFLFLLLFSIPVASKTSIVKGYKKGEMLLFDGEKLPLKDTHGKHVVLERRAADDFLDLVSQAAKDGYYISVNYGFRTMRDQRKVYRKYSRACRRNSRYCGMAAIPGFSTHQEGKSVDISGCVKYYTKAHIDSLSEGVAKSLMRSCTEVSRGRYMCKTVLYWWLKKNGPDYGFENDVESEPWHWTHSDVSILEVGG